MSELYDQIEELVIEIEGDDIEGRVRGPLERAGQPAHKRVRSVGLHRIHHHASSPASAQGLHEGGR